MNSKNAIFLLFLVLIAGSFSQTMLGQSLRAKNWAYPMSNGLEFNSNGTTAFASSAALGNAFLNRGTSTISDEDGNLVLYSNGKIAWNASHNVISGGNNLVGSKFATQTSIIIPWPTSPGRYFLFVLDSLGQDQGMQQYLVDMTLNGGQGMVFPGPTVLIDSATEKIAATHHGNDRDYWVVGHRWNSDEFHAFLVDPNGVSTTPVVSAVGFNHGGLTNGAKGQMKISPDGRKIALVNFTQGFVQLFDFDNQTGIISNPITLDGPSAVLLPYGLEFSSDSKKLFYTQSFSASPSAEIFQFDLDHASEDCLLASKTSVGIPNPIKIMGDLQLALDKRIYLTYEFPVAFNDSLGVLFDPNAYGSATGFSEAGGPVSLGPRLTAGLTNYVSSYVSDGIRDEIGTNCFGINTLLFPEDTAGIDSARWDFGDPASGNNSSTTLQGSHLFSAADTFTVTLYRFENGATDTLTRDVIIWNRNLNLLGSDTTLCAGQSTTLDGTWNGACLEWSTGATSNTISVSTPGDYWVDVFYHSCVFRDSVEVITVNGPPQFDLGNDTAVCAGVTFTIDPDLQTAFYTWQDGSHDTTFAVSNTGTYWLEAENACGTSSDTLKVTLDQAAQPVVSFPDDTTACDTVPFIVDVTFSLATYTWSDGITTPVRTITSPGVYWVEVGNSCDTVSDTMTVAFDAQNISGIPSLQVLCDGTDEVRLAALTNGDDVLWNTGLTADTLVVNQSGTYSYLAENTCGQFRDTSVIVDWNSDYVLDIGNDTSLCASGDTFFLAHADETFPFDYLWSTGTVGRFDIASTAGRYTITATNRCTTMVSSRNLELIEPTGILDLPIRNACEAQPLRMSIAPNTTDVQWSSGQVIQSIEVTGGGSYFVTFTDSAGCLQADSVFITENCVPQIFVPNVFSPNSDGVNDKMCFEIENARSVTIQIYNRWGAKLYDSADPETCWDGRTNVGEPAVTGTYFYIVEMEDSEGASFIQTGTVNLFR